MSLFPIIPPAPVVPVTVSQTASGTSTTNGTVFTFSSLSLGTVKAGRIIGVFAGGGGPTVGARDITSLTVAGSAAANVLTANSSTHNHYSMEMFDIVDATNSTGDIVVTFNNTMDQCLVLVYAIQNANPATSATATDIDTSGTDTASLTMTIKENGISVGAAYGNQSRTHVWTGIDEDTEITINDIVASGASKAFSTLQTNLTHTATPSSTVSWIMLGTAAYEPA